MIIIVIVETQDVAVDRRCWTPPGIPLFPDKRQGKNSIDVPGNTFGNNIPISFPFLLQSICELLSVYLLNLHLQCTVPIFTTWLFL